MSPKRAKQADILVISPHPDDAEFGAAGSVARWVREGKQIVYIICTNGNKGTSDRSIKPEDLAQMREKEQLAAANVLGVREVVFLQYPDQELEDTPDFRKDIVRQIRLFRPLTVMTADPYRRYLVHRDHRIAGQVTLDAVYPYARDYLAYPDLIEEGLETHIVEEVLLWGTEDINYRVNITETFDIKLAALRCHKSQVDVSAKMEGWLRERARSMAEGQKFKLAEAFHLATIPSPPHHKPGRKSH